MKLKTLYPHLHQRRDLLDGLQPRLEGLLLLLLLLLLVAAAAAAEVVVVVVVRGQKALVVVAPALCRVLEYSGLNRRLLQEDKKVSQI